MRIVYHKHWFEDGYITKRCDELQKENTEAETTQYVEFLKDSDGIREHNEILRIPKECLIFQGEEEEEEFQGIGRWWEEDTLTKRRLQWFVTLREAIERRGTVCSDYIYRAKIPSIFSEELSSIDNETFVMRRHMRGEWYYTEFPIACLWDDAALHVYRETREQKDAQKRQQADEYARQTERNALERLAQKYPDLITNLVKQQEVRTENE